MSVRSTILLRLAASANLAVEAVVEQALLAGPSATEQQELFTIIETRDMRPGWAALIKVYHQLAEEIQQKLLQRHSELFRPLSDAMQDIEGPARGNVIEIIRRSEDPRLVYLLAQALMDSRPEIRESAGESLLAAAIRHQQHTGEPAFAEMPHDPEAASELRRALDHSLRLYKTHKQQTALLAAVLSERQQDGPTWAHFQDSHDEITRAAASLLRNPSPQYGPALAAATLLALGSPLKPAAMAGLASAQDLPTASAIARESFRLLDPVLRDAAAGIGNLKPLHVLWKEAPPSSDTWQHWLHLLQAVGLQPVEKMMWLTRLLERAPTSGEYAVTWKLTTMRAIADGGGHEAGRLFARLLSDPSERVARCAARHMLSRRHADWRSLIAGSPIPHASVRRMLGAMQAAGSGGGALGNKATIPSLTERLAAITANDAAGAENPEFPRVWSEYPEMPPAVQHSTARTLANADPQYIEQMKTKLSSAIAADVAQGLKMIAVLPSIVPFRGQIIALCGHPDVRIASVAVKLVGRLEDPRLKELLEAAAHHADGRVRANAVEAMAALRIARHSQQVLAMIHSRHNRERANAIKAISEFDFTTAKDCLRRMLADTNPLHRISALWVIEQLALPELFRQVSVLARRDPNARVRKRASDMLESLTGDKPLEPMEKPA
jgi:HEAT repeat protein